MQNIQHGYGQMFFPDGTIKEGYFENNCYKIQVDVLDQNGHLKRSNQQEDNSEKTYQIPAKSKGGVASSDFSRDIESESITMGSHL